MNTLVKKMVLGPVKTEAKKPPNPIVLDLKSLTAIVGVIALAMPLVLYFGARIIGYCNQSSISHYYFLPFFGSVFVGSMGFIGVFLLCYKGHTKLDRIFALIAGVAAFLVAIFPTAKDGCAKTDFLGRAFVEWSATASPNPTVFYDIVLLDLSFPDGGLTSQHVHVAAAAVLFLILGYFAFWSFRRDNGEGVAITATGTPVVSAQKARRNFVYLICGIVIFVCIAILLWLALTHDTSDGVTNILPPVFAYEMVALFAFGISWIIKGRLVPYFNDPGTNVKGQGRAA